MSILVGVIYLVLGLASTATIVGRLYLYWESYAKPRKALLIGYTLVMFSFTHRAIELLWFDAPGPRPPAVVAILGASVCLWAFLMPEDKRLEPESWKSHLRQQEGEEVYDRYMEILDRSAKARNAPSKGAEHYKTIYMESE